MVSAVSAVVRVICAASAVGARGRTSCKRQASGSNPLTGSQVSEGFSLAGAQPVERMSAAGIILLCHPMLTTGC